MIKILDMVVAKLQRLKNSSSSTDAKLVFDIGHTGIAEVHIPPTKKARELLWDLLTEIGRHECALDDKVRQDFVRLR